MANPVGFAECQSLALLPGETIVSYSKVRIFCTNSEPRAVTCFARFKREIQGETHEFAITPATYGAGQVLTHVASGRKVCALGVPATFLPAYAKLKAGSYCARGEMSLDAWIAARGEAVVRSVLASAPDLQP